MFDILAELVKILLEKIPGLFFKGICRELKELFEVIEDLLRQATAFYNLFKQYCESSGQDKTDPEIRQKLRKELKELLQSLMRYEKRLKEISEKLSLLDEKDLSIRLVKVSGSSYDLFKTYFVDDLAPKFIANTTGTQYILRRTKKKTEINSSVLMISVISR